MNPTKPGAASLRDAAIQACAARYLPAPLWLETTEQDPGVGQARKAVADGADVVIAAGGDGTVRAVAEGLVGTGAAMGLVPLGTGNLLARNLDLPLGNLPAQLRIALTGTDRPIDVGWVTVVRDAEQGPAASADGDAPLAGRRPTRRRPTRPGRPAGPRAHLPGDRRARLRRGDGRRHRRRAQGARRLDRLLRRRASGTCTPAGCAWTSGSTTPPGTPSALRSLLIGNCGRLPGGITLLPGAELDDGWLDVGAIDTRGGLVGWSQLFGEVAMQRFGIRTELPNRIGRIDHSRAKRIRVRSRDAQQVQVDGDLIGAAYELEARVDRLALIVKVD